jgi:hypothetical protein
MRDIGPKNAKALRTGLPGMNRPGRNSIVLGAVLVLVGILLATLPKDWLETNFGIEPDAGDGFVELLIFLLPIVVGAAIMARGVMAWRRWGLRFATVNRRRGSR